MKNNWIVLAAAVVGMATASLQAVPITGSIGFTGTYTQNGGTAGNLSTAVSMTINTFAIGVATDDLAGAIPVSFASPIGVNGNPPSLVGGQLWSVNVGGTIYTFDVTTLTQTFTSATQINLEGSGIMKNGVDEDTAGTWQLGFGKTGAAFTWQSTSATNIPDGGTTVMLLGAALSGLGLIRRKLVA